MRKIQYTVAASLAALLLASSANAQLNTNIVNGGFTTNGGSFFNPVVTNWLEHEVYGGAGPDGYGCGIWGPQVISGVSGSSLSLIAGDSGTNTSTVMQSLGTVAASDVGKNFRLSAGAVAWDWYSTVKPFSGTVTVSFRAGCVPDNGWVGNFVYGNLLGTAGSVTTGVTAAGDGTQNGVGDDGGLIAMAANYTPAAGDIGTEVFAVINLGPVQLAPAGESRFVVDNVAVSVAQTPTTTTLVSSPNPSGWGSNVTFTATVKTNSATATAVTGTVNFKEGATTLGSSGVTNGVALFSTSGLGVGSHMITAEYSGDAIYSFSASTTVTQVVTGDMPISVAVLTNGGFEINNGDAADPIVHGWLEHEVYGGPGPNGYGACIFPYLAPYISNATGSATLVLIAGIDIGPNTATVMQPLGTVTASDVGKTFTFSAGAVAWDWNADVKPFSGTITVSFRTGCAPDSSFSYGSVVGTEGSVTTGVTVAGDAVQNGVGDDGGLKPIVATYSPTSGDIGTPVFAVINLGDCVKAPVGETRFSVDNATLTVQSSVPSAPTNITWSVSGGNLHLSWPSNYLGWILQGQTNAPNKGLGTNWVDISGSAAVTSTNLPISPANPSVFYRLRHP